MDNSDAPSIMNTEFIGMQINILKKNYTKYKYLLKAKFLKKRINF